VTGSSPPLWPPLRREQAGKTAAASDCFTGAHHFSLLLLPVTSVTGQWRMRCAAACRRRCYGRRCGRAACRRCCYGRRCGMCSHCGARGSRWPRPGSLLLVHRPCPSHPPFHFANLATESFIVPKISHAGPSLPRNESEWPAKRPPARRLPSFAFTILIL
jgi:hypothetical protein